MNSLIYKKQKELDFKIHGVRSLSLQDTYQKRIVALSVELAEFANEIRFFKFWSSKEQDLKKALEESADCLHFIASLANSLGVVLTRPEKITTLKTIDFLYLEMQNNCFSLHCGEREKTLQKLYENFIYFNFKFGIRLVDIEEAYYKKNNVNHQRQKTDY